MKFDSLKNKKISLPIYMLAFLVILVFALIFGLIFGFNKGFDFTGGTQLVVSFESSDALQSEEGINNCANKTREILNKYNININTFQVQGSYYDKCFVITFKEKSPSTLRQIRLDLNKEFNKFNIFTELEETEKDKILDNSELNFYDITKNTIEIESLIPANIIIATIASILVVLTLFTIYFCFRFSFASGMLILIGGLLDLILFNSLIILSRIEINSYFFVLLAIILLVSVYSCSSFVFSIKNMLSDTKNNNKNYKELIDICVKENFAKNIIIYAVILCLSFIVGIFSVVPIIHLGLASIMGIIVLFVTHNLVLPDLFVLLNKNKKAQIVENKKKKEKEVEISTKVNNADTNAEVVEIEENDGLKDS